MRADLAANFRPLPSWKRAVDVAAACAMLLTLAPLLILVAVMVKATSRGPIFFAQRRHGAAGKLFTMWKFRTMRVDADSNHHKKHIETLAGSDKPLTKINADEDYIPLARLWRATGIDELPQLINVLRGEMSLVGPRPDVLGLDAYETWQLRRFEVTPGLTGLWQVKGKNRTTFQQMIRLDIEYVDNRSPGLDVAILLKTVPAVIRYALA